MATRQAMNGARRSLRIFQADAFSASPFAGNPAAVCLVDVDHDWRKGPDAPSEAGVMQRIAMEMNLAETAFLRPLPGGSFASDRFSLRWFTPSVEVNLCGHATLATAAVLFYELDNPHNVITFDTLSGPLQAERVGDRIEMSLPLNMPATVQTNTDLHSLVQELANACSIDMSTISEYMYSETTKKLMIRLSNVVSRDMLEKLPVVPSSLLDVPNNDGIVKGVIITVKAQPNSGGGDKTSTYDFFSRYFAPWVAIPEDSVTGSAHTVLAGYWSKCLEKKELHARQCSSRGGDIWLRTDTVEKRLYISGAATVVLRGDIMLE